MFSEAVDNVIRRSGRPEKLNEAIVAVRNSLRKAHSVSYFPKDLEERLIVSDATDYIWNFPRNFRAMATVRYGPDTYPKNLQPGKIQKDQTQFWYQMGTAIVFSGIGIGTELRLAFYVVNKKFKYYEAGTRPAVWDDEAEIWNYLQPDGTTYGPSLATTELEDEARAKVSNWLLDEWTDLAEEGWLASVFKLVNDDRTRTHYANFNNLIETLKQAESVSGLGY